VVELPDMDGQPLDLTRLRTIPLADRVSTVGADQFAAPLSFAGASAWLDALPRLLAGSDLRTLVQALAEAPARGRPVIAAIGAHVIKCGLAPVLLELMDRGVITGIATNGATIVHDVEIALAGKTSEDVTRGLRDGTFGMAEETHRFCNHAVRQGVAAGHGLGAAVGQALLAADAPHAAVSLFAGAARRGVPVTVHVAIGTDVLHMHPTADGAAIGEGSLRDFRALTAQMAALGGGGVLLNVGSAVILPEVILKAFGILRNLGHDLTGFLSADLDFVRHYRGSRQVVERVKELGGRGIALTGHHEIMLPLIAALVADRQGKGDANRKFLDRQEVAAAMDRYRATGRRIVFTNGCFDLLHAGHVRYLREARSRGDLLVVGVNTDASVRRLKGDGRPLVSEAERAELLAALECVDHVTLFSEETPEALITEVRPSLHVKGGDYQVDDLPETRLVRELGGEVEILPFTRGHSTSALVQQLGRLPANGESVLSP
jgi:rfaE bifunctional protein nucleotidyltransferase chain/domain